MRLLGTLFVLLLALAVFGYVRGWFFVDTVEGASSTHSRVVVDSDKVTADVESAKEKVGDITKRVKEFVVGKATRNAEGQLEVDGTILAVDVARHSLQLQIDDMDLAFAASDSTPIVIDGKEGKLADLSAGRKVRIWLTAVGDQLQLQRVEAQ